MGRDNVQFGRWVLTFCGNALSPSSSIFMATEDGSNASFQDFASYPPNSRCYVFEYRNSHALVLPHQGLVATDTFRYSQILYLIFPYNSGSSHFLATFAGQFWQCSNLLP